MDISGAMVLRSTGRAGREGMVSVLDLNSPTLTAAAVAHVWTVSSSKQCHQGSVDLLMETAGAKTSFQEPVVTTAGGPTRTGRDEDGSEVPEHPTTVQLVPVRHEPGVEVKAHALYPTN